jgi:hypothetical protein
MSECDVPYLWYPRGRNAWYPTYRRDGLRRALKSPDGKRIKVTERRIVEQGDPSILAAWLPIHESFEAEKTKENEKDDKERPEHWVYNRSTAHAIDSWLDEVVPSLAPATQALYKHYAREIRDQHGHRPAATMPRDAVVKMVNERKKKTPGAAKMLLATLRAIFAYLEDHPLTFGISENWRNPTIGRRRKKGENQSVGWAPWEEWMVEKFRQRWPIGTIERTLFEMYLNSGQRGCDVATRHREHIHGGIMAVVQQKTHVPVWIPVLDDLHVALEVWLGSHDSEAIFPATYGKNKGKAMIPATVQAIMRRAIRLAGLPTTCKPHGGDSSGRRNTVFVG